ncbi:tetraspanin family protein [Corynebacterium glyciniphilum]|uniref:tetraspanin family protein n=1 Tax=Corynebacterium glyciniphilum TaxID=1404244 RepID=UPI002352D0C8
MREEPMMFPHSDTKGEHSASPEYLEGYVPSSWDAPHSSLHRGVTWMSMGLLLCAVFIMGIGIFGFAAYSVDAQEHGITIGIVGWAVGIVLLLVSFLGVHMGRRGTREYRKETGRVY